MTWEWVVVAAIVAGCVVIGIVLWRNEARYLERKNSHALSLEIERARLAQQQEALRQRGTIELARELGRQMLGTLRPGETLPAVEEDVPSPVQGDGWWNEEIEGIDPTDASLPDDLRVDPTEEADGGVENLG